MLNPKVLENEIYTAFKETLLPAVSTALANQLGYNGERENTLVKNFSETIDDVCLHDLSERLALAIDAYIKKIDLDGTLLIYPGQIMTTTVGNKHTQMGPNTNPVTISVKGTTVPQTNGLIPNTLGIH